MKSRVFPWQLYVFVVLGFVDLCWTAYLLETKLAIEANPVLSYFYTNFGIIGFAIVKIIIGILVPIVICYILYQKQQTEIAKKLISSCLALYVIICFASMALPCVEQKNIPPVTYYVVKPIGETHHTPPLNSK